MSDKITVSEVAEVIKRFKIEPETTREIIEALNERIAAAEADSPEPKPRGKQQYCILVSDPAGKIPQGLVGWVVQIPENASPASVNDRVNKAAHEFNATKKGRLIPVKSVGEAMESVKRKHFKNAELAVKTKMPVAVLVTNNKLSEAPSV